MRVTVFPRPAVGYGLSVQFCLGLMFSAAAMAAPPWRKSCGHHMEGRFVVERVAGDAVEVRCSQCSALVPRVADTPVLRPNPAASQLPVQSSGGRAEREAFMPAFTPIDSWPDRCRLLYAALGEPIEFGALSAKGGRREAKQSSRTGSCNDQTTELYGRWLQTADDNTELDKMSELVMTSWTGATGLTVHRRAQLMDSDCVYRLPVEGLLRGVWSAMLLADRLAEIDPEVVQGTSLLRIANHFLHIEQQVHDGPSSERQASGDEQGLSRRLSAISFAPQAGSIWQTKETGAWDDSIASLQRELFWGNLWEDEQTKPAGHDAVSLESLIRRVQADVHACFRYGNTVALPLAYAGSPYFNPALFSRFHSCPVRRTTPVQTVDTPEALVPILESLGHGQLLRLAIGSISWLVYRNSNGYRLLLPIFFSIEGLHSSRQVAATVQELLRSLIEAVQTTADHEAVTTNGRYARKVQSASAPLEYGFQWTPSTGVVAAMLVTTVASFTFYHGFYKKA